MQGEERRGGGAGQSYLARESGGEILPLRRAQSSHSGRAHADSGGGPLVQRPLGAERQMLFGRRGGIQKVVGPMLIAGKAMRMRVGGSSLIPGTLV